MYSSTNLTIYDDRRSLNRIDQTFPDIRITAICLAIFFTQFYKSDVTQFLNTKEFDGIKNYLSRFPLSNVLPTDILPRHPDSESVYLDMIKKYEVTPEKSAALKQFMISERKLQIQTLLSWLCHLQHGNK